MPYDSLPTVSVASWPWTPEYLGRNPYMDLYYGALARHGYSFVPGLEIDEAYLRAKRERMGHTLHHQGLPFDEEMLHSEHEQDAHPEAGGDGA